MPPRPEDQDVTEAGTAVEARARPDTAARAASLRTPAERSPTEAVDALGASPTRRPLPISRPTLFASGHGPPPPSLSGVLARRWWLILLLAVLGAAAGIAAAVQRSPEYTVRSEYNVGSVNLRNQAVPGFEEGAESLASAYARIVGTTVILAPVARRTRTPLPETAERLSADPVPNSPVLRLTATGASPAQARALNTAGGEELQLYVRRQEQASRRSEALLRRYRSATQRATELGDREGRLRARRRLGQGSTTRAQVRQASVAADTQRLEAETIGNLYREAVDREGDGLEIELLEQTGSPSSDRVTFLQRLGFVGFIGGSALGVVFALALGRRAQRRSRVAAP